MQRLTLILSDLYLPEEAAGRALPLQPIELPGLDRLLRFAAGPRRIDDWRHWLAAQLDQTHFARLPVALACEMQFLARGIGAGWLATPVHLEARLDHVRLVDRGVLRIAEAQRAAWCDEFARVFGPQYSLHDIGERAFLLTGIAPAATPSLDPLRLLDSDIGAALPRGTEAAELRRLGAEIEMWLHGSTLNSLREQARQLRVSALWLWGGGLPPGDIRVGHSAVGEVQFHGDDPFLRALAESFADTHRRGVRLAPAPENYQGLGRDAPHAVIELSPMTGPPHQSLQSIETNWFAPVCAALASGSLEVCDVVANDRWFEVRSGTGWKFWRSRTSWLERLGSETGESKA